MRQKIGAWRSVELLTEKDYRIMKRNKDPKYLAKKYRWSSTFHLVVFVIIQSIFWMYGTESFNEIISYVTDLSWMEAGTARSEERRVGKEWRTRRGRDGWKDNRE